MAKFRKTLMTSKEKPMLNILDILIKDFRAYPKEVFINNMRGLVVRFALDSVFPTERDLRRSFNYVENFATEEKRKMGRRCEQNMHIIYENLLREYPLFY